MLDPADPEALVYADNDGTQQLVAVEWVSTAPGEVLGIPLHLNHDLDVWCCIRGSVSTTPPG